MDCELKIRRILIRHIIVTASITAFLLSQADQLCAQEELRASKEEDAAAPTWPIDPSIAPRPVANAVFITQAIEIDGVLDEPAWQQVDSTSGFILNLPRVGYPASERTAVRLLYDDKNLYIGATMYDSEPDRIIIAGLDQDFETHNSDLFGIALDTYHDRQNAFLFAVNPGGAIFDAQVFNDSRYTNRAWEGVIHVDAQIHDFGWTAEIAIPFTTLRFNGIDGEQVWGINFLRRVRRKNEDAYWAPVDRQHRVHKMSRAGTLTGLTDLQQGRNLTVKPYLRAARQEGVLRTDDSGNQA
ncbi:MAG: carbohydrate binding family 9 domain-containing protein, partial [Gemmatimonadota bacterium]